jgi:hypothetical protein
VVARTRGLAAILGRGFVFAVRVVEAALDPPDQVSGQRLGRIAAHLQERTLVERKGLRRLKQPERIFDLPDEAVRETRADADNGSQRQRDGRRQRLMTHDVTPPRFVKQILTLCLVAATGNKVHG